MKDFIENGCIGARAYSGYEMETYRNLDTSDAVIVALGGSHSDNSPLSSVLKRWEEGYHRPPFKFFEKLLGNLTATEEEIIDMLENGGETEEYWGDKICIMFNGEGSAIINMSGKDYKVSVY